MRALTVFAVVVVCSCQSGVSLDVDGGTQFPCAPGTATSNQCPGNLFCGFDGFCHRPDVGGDYACREDTQCGGGFRCGSAGRCIDPSADALRAGAPDVTLRPLRVVNSKTPWDAGITALGIGRGAFQALPNGGGLTDVTPLAVAQGRHVYSVASSTKGLTVGAPGQPPQNFFVGVADLGAPVSQVVAVRNTVLAIAGNRTFGYQWSASFDGGVPAIAPGVPVPAVGTRLRAGNSGYPVVFEFTPDAGHFRWWDTVNLGAIDEDFNGFNPQARITDMTDTDGIYAYALVEGLVQISNRRQALLNGSFSWGTFAINSPGRDVALTNCSGSGSTLDYVPRSLHIGDNPDLARVESPLVGLAIDVLQGDAGMRVPYWMRIDPDPAAGFCGTDRPRHIVRGICPACAPGERLVDLQWGIDLSNDPVLRAECTNPDGSRTIFYDHQTDSTGYACFREERPGVGYRGKPTLRSTSSSSMSILAAGPVVQFRRNGFDEFLGITLDRAPLIAQTYRRELVAISQGTVYRDIPQLGLALHDQTNGKDGFPAWITGDWLIYDDGRVGSVENLFSPPQEAKILATPTRRDLAGPVFGTSARALDGGSFIVMVANDALLGADLSDTANRRASIEVRAVPEPQVAIRSVAVLDRPATDAGSIFQGYVLTENRVFQLDAVTDERWTLSTLNVPEGNGVEVWADVDRGRVGFPSGRVYSLPNAVLIGQGGLDAGVRDYQQFCGRSFALNERGLYRLEKSDGPIGTWVRREELQAGPPWQRMYAGPGDAGELWVFAADGTAVLFEGAPCTP